MQYRAFLSKLRESRKKAGVSVEELANLLNIKWRQYYMIEAGKSPLKMEDYFLLCERFGVSLTYFLTEKEQTDKEEVLQEKFEKLSAHDARIVRALITLMD